MTIKIILLLILMLLLSSCTVYSYEHKGSDGSICRVNISSMRDFKRGALDVGKSCQIGGDMSNAQNGKAAGDIVGAAVKAALTGSGGR